MGQTMLRDTVLKETQKRTLLAECKPKDDSDPVQAVLNRSWAKKMFLTVDTLQEFDIGGKNDTAMLSRRQKTPPSPILTAAFGVVDAGKGNQNAVHGAAPKCEDTHMDIS